MSLRRGVLFALPPSLLVWLAVGLALVACTTPEPFPAPTGGGMPQPLARAVTLDTAEAPQHRYGPRGRFRVVHKSACDRSDHGGNPLVFPDLSMPPTVGEPLRVMWTTEGTVAPFPAAPAVLLISLGDVQPVELAGVGLPGCTFHVDGNPKNLHVFAPGTVPWLTQDGGRIWLHWTPTPIFAGVEINMQLAVKAPGANAAGWLLSPGLELWVGRGDT